MLSQARHDDGCCLSTGYDHGLFTECLNDFSREASAHARCEFGEAVGEGFLAGRGKFGGRRVSLKQIEHGWMVEAWPQNPFQRGMDLGEQAANAVAGLRDLRGEIVIETAQHCEFGELFVGQSKRAQRMRHRTRSFCNDRGIAGVCLGFARMQIGNTAHGQTRQIGNQNALVTCDCQGQRADGGGLIDDEQKLAVCLEFGDEGTQFGLVVGQSFVPFALLKSIDAGPITNHVNFVRDANGQFAYVTVGALNQVQVFRTDDFTPVATIPVGNLPHGIWPSGDGKRVYVGLENNDEMVAIDTLTNQVIATVPIGQAPQAVAYVPNAVTQGDGTQNLQALDVAGRATNLTLMPVGAKGSSTANAPTTVALFDQGLLQVLQVSASGLLPRQQYLLGLAATPDGKGAIEGLALFMTNPAGAAIVNAIGQIRQVVSPGDAALGDKRRYLVIAPSKDGKPAELLQVQAS